VTFIDDSNRKVWVYFLKHKSDVFVVLKKWLAQVKNEPGKLKCLKSDNRGEYYDGGTRRVKTVPTNPHQHRMTERIDMTILEHARSMTNVFGQMQSTQWCI